MNCFGFIFSYNVINKIYVILILDENKFETKNQMPTKQGKRNGKQIEKKNA